MSERDSKKDIPRDARDTNYQYRVDKGKGHAWVQLPPFIETKKEEIIVKKLKKGRKT